MMKRNNKIINENNVFVIYLMKYKIIKTKFFFEIKIRE